MALITLIIIAFVILSILLSFLDDIKKRLNKIYEAIINQNKRQYPRKEE